MAIELILEFKGEKYNNFYWNPYNYKELRKLFTI